MNYSKAEQDAYDIGFRLGQQIAKTKRDFEKVNKAIWTETYRDQIEELTKQLSQIDDWHPASEPPTDKDFEPTGCVDIYWKENDYVYQVGQSGIKNYEDWTHWRKITPPKQ